MDHGTVVIAVIYGLSTAAGLSFAGKLGGFVWSKLTRTPYVTEEQCRQHRDHCHAAHKVETADAAQELREIRRMVVLICQRLQIDPKEYQGLIK
jgi:hypothetical protein